jgi:hypothetical protein
MPGPAELDYAKTTHTRDYMQGLKRAAIFAFTMCVVYGFAATPPIRFAPPVKYAVGTHPNDVTVGDLNGDGKLDLMVTTVDDGNVVVLLGKGDGSFLQTATYSVNSEDGSWPSAITSADFNGDGKLDVAAATGASNILLYLGEGNGSLRPPVRFPSGASPMSLGTGDLNGDGKLDLLIGGNGNAAFLLGGGDGTFQPPQYLAMPYSPSIQITAQPILAMADLDGNNQNDIVSGNWGYYIPSVAAYTSTGPAIFNDPVLYYDPGFSIGNGIGITGVALPDVNGDGKPDIVASIYSGNALLLFIGNGDGTFKPDVLYYGGSSPYRIAVADFNGDSKVDVAISNFNDLESSFPGFLPDGFGVTVYPSAGDGTFDLFGGFLQFDQGTQAGAIATGDFNGDGRADIVTANPNTNDVSVLLNGGAMNVSVKASANPIPPNQPVTITAKVVSREIKRNKPTGTVTFLAGSGGSGTGSTVLGDAPLESNGTARFTVSFPMNQPRSQSIIALYSGDSKHVGSSSLPYNLRLGLKSVTNLRVRPHKPAVGSALELVATVISSQSTPTGTVYFYADDTFLAGITLLQGAASYSASLFAAGCHVVRSYYVPDEVSSELAYSQDSVSFYVSSPQSGKKSDHHVCGRE